MRLMLCWTSCLLVSTVSPAETWPVTKDTGYRGIWYANQATKDEYVYKYSGGLGTYCAKHIPMAVYAPAVDKTFFVYGGRKKNENTVLEMVSYYDHRSGTVPRPTILMDKGTADAHDNPVIALDGEGRLLVLASAHGTARPAYIFRSTKPYDIDSFELVLERNFSYPQPWFLGERGFLFLHTHYNKGRTLNWSTSPGGDAWSERRLLAHIEQGHYQISWPHKEKVGTAFNYHPTAFQGGPKKLAHQSLLRRDRGPGGDVAHDRWLACRSSHHRGEERRPRAGL